MFKFIDKIRRYFSEPCPRCESTSVGFDHKKLEYRCKRCGFCWTHKEDVLGL